MSAGRRVRAIPKVLPPQLGRILTRAPLAKSLLDASAAGAVWVEAPGGAGKTTAVASLAASLGLPVAWLHADAGDAQLASFFRFLGLAIGAALPKAALPAYGPELEPESDLFARRFARAAIESAKAGKVVLAIDNLQDIPAGSRVHSAIAAIAEELSGAWKVFLVTRQHPGPAYSRLLGQGRLVLLSPDRFVFTEAEIKETLRQRGILDEARLDALWKQSRGWIAGALLLAMNPEGSAGSPGTTKPADSSGLFAYFADQSFSGLDAGDRRLLLHTAYLPTVRPESVAGLAQVPDAPVRLKALAGRGLFVTRIAGDPERYRYHDLFREFLQAQALEVEGPEGVERIKRRSASRLAADGEPLPALELLAECGDWVELGRVATAEAETLLDQGHFRSLGSLLLRVPGEHLETEPWLLYWLAQCEMGVSDSEAVRHLVKAHAIFVSRGDREGQLISSVNIPLLLRNQVQVQADYVDWIPTVEALADSAWEIRSPFLAIKVTTGMLSLAAVSSVLAPGMGRLVERILELAPRIEDPNTRLQSLTQIVAMAWRLRHGEMVPRAAGLVDDGRLEERASPLLVLHWYLELIVFDTMYGDWRRSIASAERSRQMAIASGLASARFEALLNETEVSFDRNDVVRSRRLVAEIVREVDPARPNTVAVAKAVQARLALIEGDADGALASVREAIAFLESRKYPVGYTQAYFALEAGALALGGRFAEALECGERWRKILIGPHRPIVDVYEAWIEAARAVAAGDPAARELLGRALAAARRHDYPMALRHANRLAAELCSRALAWSIDPEYVSAMIARRGLVAPDLDSPAWPWPVRVRCMGGFEILRQGEAVAAQGRSQKTTELLQVVVALEGKAPVDRLIPLLWPGEGRVGAQHALETTLYRLRKLLGSDACITVTERQLVLNRREMWVDALAIGGILARIEALERPPDEATIRLLVELHAGYFLPHRTQEAWAIEARDKVWTRVRRVLVAAARRERENGDHERAERLLYFVIDRHGTAEDAFAELMRLHIGLGQPGEALHAFRRCCAALASELRIEPGPELRSLAAGIGAGAPR